MKKIDIVVEVCMYIFVFLITSIFIIFFIYAVFDNSNAITEGEVYKKEYRDAYTTVQLMPLITSNGKTSTTMLIPYVISYPERYVVFIKAYKEEQWKTEDYYVSKDVYDKIHIGDMFLYDKYRGDLKEEPYTKERQKY